MDSNPSRVVAKRIGGAKRWRSGGSMTSLKGARSRICVDGHEDSHGYELPTDKATKKQTDRLDDIGAEFIQRVAASGLTEFPARVLAIAFKVSERKAAEIKADAISECPSQWLCRVVLEDMRDGRLAGVAGHRFSEATEKLFERVANWKMTAYPPREIGTRPLSDVHAAFRNEFSTWKRGD
jgi:hypothetical protein